MKKRVSGLDSTVIHKNIMYEKWEDDNGAEFFFPLHEIAEQEPTVRWKGGKILWSDWVNICAFCEEVSEKESSECQVQLFYSDTDKKFLPWAFPQKKKSGMVTKELHDHPDFMKQLHSIRQQGYYPFGTLHTHDKMGAFQSSVDHNDEKESEGIHITLGKINRKDPYDIHTRFTAKKPGYEDEQTKELIPASYVMLPVEWTDFIEPPDSIIADRLPSFLRKKILETVLLRPDISSANKDVIKLWMDNRIEEEVPKKDHKYPTSYGYGFGQGHSSHPWRRNGDWSKPPKNWLSDKTEELEKSAFPDWEPGFNHGAGSVDYTSGGPINDPDVNEDYFMSMKKYEESGEVVFTPTSDRISSLDMEITKDEVVSLCEVIELDTETVLSLLTDGSKDPGNTELLEAVQEEVESLMDELSARLNIKVGYAEIIEALEEIEIETKAKKGKPTKGKIKSAITKRKKLKHAVRSV